MIRAGICLALLVGPLLLVLPTRGIDEPLESWFVPLCALILTLPVAWTATRSVSATGLGLATFLALAAQFAWMIDFMNENRAEGPNQALKVRACLLDDRGRETARLGQEIEHQMLGVHLRIAAIGGVLLRGNQRLARFRGESV